MKPKHLKKNYNNNIYIYIIIQYLGVVYVLHETYYLYTFQKGIHIYVYVKRRC